MTNCLPCRPSLAPPLARLQEVQPPPLATCTLDLGFETVCDPQEHHQICEVDDGTVHSDDNEKTVPTELHAE